MVRPLITSDDLIAGLDLIPGDWALTPLNDSKRPYFKDWQIQPPLSRDQIIQEIVAGKAKGYGLRTGEFSYWRTGFIAAVDFDGASAYAKWQELEAGPLPTTLGLTSGVPHHEQRLFLIPPAEIYNLRNRVVIKTAEGEQLEIRCNGSQTVLPPSVHPKTGAYRWLGTPEDSEIAWLPQWALDLLKKPESAPPSPTRVQFNQIADSDWSDTDWAMSYLEALQPWRADDYQSWVEVGMALHSAGPELLPLWEEWSSQSSKYKTGECEKKWKSFKAGGISLASLGYWAKEDGWESPFGDKRDWRAELEAEEEADTGKSKHSDQSSKTKNTFNTDDEEGAFRQLIRKMQEIHKSCPIGSALYEFKLSAFAKKIGWAARQIESIYLRYTHENFITEALSASDLLARHGEENSEWLIGGLLPLGSAVLLYADGGVGKSLLAYDLVKAVATGEDWNPGFATHKQRNVLVIQTDESELDLCRRLRATGLDQLDTVRYVIRWDFTKLEWLKQQIQSLNPGLVVIDSFSSNSRLANTEEKDAMHAAILYELRDMATEYNCTFLVLHHVNKQGVARGSTAIRNNVSECWKLRRYSPELDRIKIAYNERVLEVEKSRASVVGRHLIGLDDADMHWSYCGDLEKSEDGYDTKPATLADKIMAVFDSNPDRWLEVGDLMDVNLFSQVEFRTMQTNIRRLSEKGKLVTKKVNRGGRSGLILLYGLPSLAKVESSVNPESTHAETRSGQSLGTGFTSGFKVDSPLGEVNPVRDHRAQPESSHESSVNPVMNPLESPDLDRVSASLDSGFTQGDSFGTTHPIRVPAESELQSNPLTERISPGRSQDKDKQRSPISDYTGPEVGECVIFTPEHMSAGSLRTLKSKGIEFPWGETGQVIQLGTDYRTGRYYIQVEAGGRMFTVQDLSAIEVIR